MTWFDATPAIAAAALMLTVPGVLIGRAIGLRGLPLVASSPVISVAVTAWSAVGAGILGVDWGVVLACVTVLLAIAPRLLAKPHPVNAVRASLRPLSAVSGAWLLATGVLSWRFLEVFPSPTQIIQSHDNAFHLNAARYVIETGHASSLSLNGLGSGGIRSFYPAAWHDLVAGVSRLSDAPILTAFSSLTLVLTAGCWTVGCLYLTSRVLSEHPRDLVIGAVLSTSFATFPYLLWDFGAVYPFMLAVTLLPAAIAPLVDLLGLQRDEPHAPATMPSPVLALSAPAALTLAHPSVLLLYLAIATALLIAAHVRGTTRLSVRVGSRRLPLAWSAPILLTGAWLLVRPPRTSNWDEWGSASRAGVEALTMSPVGGPVPWALAGVVWLGVIVSVRRRHHWIVALHVFGLVCFVASQLRGMPEVRWWFAGVWYSDPFRISALLAVTALPAAAVGAQWVAVRLWRVATSPPLGSMPVWRPVFATGTLILSFLIAQSPGIQGTVAVASAKNRFDDDSALLARHELQLLERVPRHVRDGTAIAGDPMTGAALSYALTGRPTIQPMPGGLPADTDAAVIMNRLDEMRKRADVCVAVQRLGLQYVLDFGQASVNPGEISVAPGLDDLSPSTGFRTVDREGSAKLLKIIGCRDGRPIQQPSGSTAAQGFAN